MLDTSRSAQRYDRIILFIPAQLTAGLALTLLLVDKNVDNTYLSFHWVKKRHFGAQAHLSYFFSDLDLTLMFSIQSWSHC